MSCNYVVGCRPRPWDGICVQPSMHPRGRCTANGSRISAGQPKKAMRTDSANFPVVSRAKLLRLRRPPLSPAAGTCDCSSARHSRFELRFDSTGPGIPIHPRGAPQNGEDAWGNGVSVAGTRRCNGPGGAAVLGLILHGPIPGLIPAGQTEPTGSPRRHNGEIRFCQAGGNRSDWSAALTIDSPKPWKTTWQGENATGKRLVEDSSPHTRLAARFVN
jgi:hypothetical protein